VGRIEELEALLLQAEHAHGVFEATILGGVYDQDWPRWYAAYAVEHGIDGIVGHPVAVDELAELLASGWVDYQREQPDGVEPWASYTARGIAADT
jgi:hypothetical protein